MIRDRLVGQRFTRLLVVDHAGRSKSGDSLWLCKCDCGTFTKVTGGDLKRKDRRHIRSCGCLIVDTNSKYPITGAIRCVIATYKCNAKKRGLSWTINDEECVEMFDSVCHYCGIEPYQVIKGHYKEPYIYNGIDRIDNNRGYEPDNVVACCGECNKAKVNKTQTEFRCWIERVYNYWATGRPIVGR